MRDENSSLFDSKSFKFIEINNLLIIYYTESLVYVGHLRFLVKLKKMV